MNLIIYSHKLVRVIALISVTAFFSSAFAATDSPLSRQLYPNSTEDSAFVSKFFEIVETHKTNDPLLEGRGPSIREYSLDKIKFAFMVNETVDTVDLVFFNWSLSTFPGLELQSELSELYGSKVYILKGVVKKLIASQGDNHDQLTNFSYVFGSPYMEMQLKRGNPDFEVPQQILDWKPHPDYMDRSHPLRKALDTYSLVLLSPSKELFFKQTGMDENSRPYFDAMLSKQGGFYNTIMGMMVHEMFHVKEGEDQANGLAESRTIDEDRKSLVEQLKADTYLKTLISTYIKIVFSLGDQLKTASTTDAEIRLLNDLKVIVAELKAKYANAWTFIWNYEYTEGFAEYASAYSMIQAGITSFSQQIDLQKGDDSNNFAYRSGSMGGLYLATRFREMPFSNREDHRESVWEIVLRKSKVLSDQISTQGVVERYKDDGSINAEEEIERVIDYLISTEMEM